MKQPELGKKISELRKSRGLTQEELVDQCNISVRTIQRIEAGEVTPRSYTIKTILSALQYDFDKIKSEDHKVTKEFKKLLLLDIDGHKEITFLHRQLNIAWISGIVYFLIGFAEFSMDYFRYFETQIIPGKSTYILLKLLTLLSIILFFRGFILTSKILNNYLLRITAFIFIFINVLFYSYDIISLYFIDLDYRFVLGAESITYGVIGVLFGIAVFRLKNALGSIATITSIFEITSYAFMITIVLSIVGIILLTPTIILEIILLYKVAAILKAKQQEINP